MKFGLQRKHGSLNSVAVFDAVSEGLQKLGHTVVNDTLDCDVPVLWSMLWHGRMKRPYQLKCSEVLSSGKKGSNT